MKIVKLYFKELKDYNSWIEKCEEASFIGRGASTKFAEKIAREQICFLDDNLRKMLKVLLPSSE